MVTKSYMQQSGMRLSAYEHLIPETLFTDPNAPNRPQGVSAVKALAIASAQGQKIYTITGQNIATALPALTIGSEIKNEIRNAVNAGQSVTVSQGNVTVSGWTGAGYIISDPATGAGAYKISGGENGGWLGDFKIKAMFYAGTLLSILDSHPWLASALDGLAALIGITIGAVINLIDLLQNCKSIDFAIALVAIFVIANLIFEFALIISGVGLIVSFALGVLVGQLENLAINELKNSPLCKTGG